MSWWRYAKIATVGGPIGYSLAAYIEAVGGPIDLFTVLMGVVAFVSLAGFVRQNRREHEY